MLYSHLKYNHSKFNLLLRHGDKLTEVEVTLVALDLIDSSTVKQPKAVEAELLGLAHSHPSL